MKRITVVQAVMAMAAGQWSAGFSFPSQGDAFELPKREQPKEEAQRRIQAAAERRKRRNAKWAGRAE